MREYTITRGGVELTVLLSDEDAKAFGARPVEAAEKRPENKGRRPVNK